MEDKLLIAALAVLSALLGSVIPTAFNYWNNKQQRSFELQKSLLSTQKDLYLELMLSLQEIINHQENQQFYKLQECAIKAAIYGDNATSQAFYKYYNDIIHLAQNKRGLTPQEHQKHQSKILNSMRESLGLKPINEFEIIGFRPSG